MKTIVFQTLFLLFGAFAVRDVHPLGPNLALNRPALQSSTYNAAAFAKHAVDGNTDSVWSSISCTATQREDKPWWSVDLGSAKKVARVDIYNRIDCCLDRLNDFTIRIGNSNKYESNPVCVSGMDFSNVISGALKCTTPLTGRYLSVHLESGGYLTLCEVEVYSAIL